MVGSRAPRLHETRAQVSTYASEALLCTAFSEAARRDGWTVYPEQHGWDLLLARQRVQVGVQAKLEPTTHLLLQALPQLAHPGCRSRNRQALGVRADGPTYRAVLVPGFEARTEKATLDRRARFYAVAAHLRLLVLEPPAAARPWLCSWLRVGAWERGNLARSSRLVDDRPDLRFYHWHPRLLVWVPPFIPNLPAGVPNPRVCGPWQLAAVLLEQLARTRSPARVTLEDARNVSAQVGGSWNPSTLLHRFFRRTGERAPGSRCEWHELYPQLRPPSHRFPAAAAGIGLAPLPEIPGLEGLEIEDDT
jgi:hypothetical protein